MIIDDRIWEEYICKLIKIGLATVENTGFFYDCLNEKEVRRLIVESKANTGTFGFLHDVLEDPFLARCPVCGHNNENIDCPIIRCEYCDHEWKVQTYHSNAACRECIAHKTGNCNSKPNNNKKENKNGTEESRKAI